jgi:thioredoxin reductase
MQLLDCIVIGAGPAGLSASLFLARYHRRVVTFHHNSNRNIYSHGVHGFLGHHGIEPATLLARGREEVERHGGRIVEACVTRVERLESEHFRITAELEASGVESFDARRIVLATGLRDLTPSIPGFADFYGSSVFHCPDCDGYEVTGTRVAVLGNGPKTVGFTLCLQTWTDRLTLLTNGDPNCVSGPHRAQLEAAGLAVHDGTVARLEGDVPARRLERVRFDDGTALECDALFFNLGTVPASDLHTQVGCRLDEDGLVWTDDQQQTSVEGVYAAGDLTPRSQLAVVAAAEGAQAAIHVHKSLQPESWTPV